MKVAIYPGSFDPITYGHIDIATRAAQQYDKLIIGSLINPDKKYLFNNEERESLIRESLGHIPNIEIVSFEGLLVDYMKEHNLKTIVKGFRTFSDYEYEFEMAELNKKLYPVVETFFLTASPKHSITRSSTVKSLARYGGDVSDFVPPHVQEALKEKYNTPFELTKKDNGQVKPKKKKKKKKKKGKK